MLDAGSAAGAAQAAAKIAAHTTTAAATTPRDPDPDIPNTVDPFSTQPGARHPNEWITRSPGKEPAAQLSRLPCLDAK
ncbi:MAG TPA: hypothetical protein VIJ00_04810, partial [Nakamurella sp.]